MRVTLWKLCLSILTIGFIFTSASCASSSIDKTRTVSIATTPTGINQPTVSATQVNDGLPDSLTEGIQIKFWHPWSGETALAVEKMVEEFNLENDWGITVSVFAKGDDNEITNSVDLALINDEVPDLIAAPDHAIQGWFEQGEIMNITAYLQSKKWGFTEQERNSIPNVFMQAVGNDNAYISIPAYRSARMLFYNTTWAEELGINTPPEDLLQFKNRNCQALQANTQDRDVANNGTGGWFFDIEAETVLSWLKAFNGGIIPNVTPKSINFSTKENYDAFQYLFRLFHDDCAWIGKDDKPYMYFAGRKALTYSGRIEDILIQARAEKIGGFEDEWTVMPYPGLNGKPIMLITGDSFAILTKDAQQALAGWLFARWMTYAPQSALIVEASGSLPITIQALDLLKEFRQNHPQWDKVLQLLPFAEKMPINSHWQVIAAVMQDSVWQLTQFYQQESNLQTVLEQAESTMNELIANDE